MDRKNILIAILTFGLALSIGYALWIKADQAKPYTQQVALDNNSKGTTVAITDTSLKNELEFFTQSEPIKPEQVPDELKSYIFDSYYANQYPNLMDCFDQIKTCSLIDKTLTLSSFDLDSDGKEEYIVMPIKICDCPLRGASGNGDILVVKNANKNFEIIGKLRGNGFLISKDRTNGYYDVLTNFHSSAATGNESLYKFQVTANGDTNYNQYEEVFSKWYDYTRTKEYQDK